MQKRFIHSLTLSILVCIAGFASAQTVDKTPPNFKDKIPQAGAVFTISSNINNAQEREKAEQERLVNHDKMWRFGKEITTDIHFFEEADVFTLPNGDVLRQLNLVSKNALSINLILESFELVGGTELYLTDIDRTQYIGAYTKANNSEAKVLGTELLPVDRMTIVVYEPKAVVGQSSFVIKTVVHGFDNVVTLAQKSLNSSGDCHYDVNCPEGAGWQSQRNSVAMMINGGGFCTGSLVYNTSGNVFPYFLSARHCGTNPSNWIFRFRWESAFGQTSCATTQDSGNGPTDRTVNGAVLRAENNTSDFLLTELNALPDPMWGVYYNGWDRSDQVNVSRSTGIHHPDGDVKKISKDFNPPAQQTVTFAGAQNRVWVIADWDLGTTEPGSSGSPLFNQDKRVIGVLSGGFSACSGTDDNGEIDFYGRFGYAWDNGPTPDKRLKDWLDPDNLDVPFIDGYDPALDQDTLDASISNFDGLGSSTCESTTNVNFVLLNSGSNELTNVVIKYGYDGNLTQTYNWTGSLNNLESALLALPLSLPLGQHTFGIEIESVEGLDDQDASNDRISHSFLRMSNDAQLQLDLQIDCYGEETSWEILNANDDVVYSGGPYQSEPNPDAVVRDMCFEEGCYTFKLYDTYGDGMSGCDASEGGNGSFTLSNLSTGEVYAELADSAANFGSEFTQPFCITLLDVPAYDLNQLIKLYPNPGKEQFIVQSSDSAPIQNIRVYTIAGKVVANMQYDSAKVSVATSDLPASVYIIEVSTSQGQTHLRWVKQ